jgi:hypothetical protein
LITDSREHRTLADLGQKINEFCCLRLSGCRCGASDLGRDHRHRIERATQVHGKRAFRRQAQVVNTGLNPAPSGKIGNRRTEVDEPASVGGLLTQAPQEVLLIF